MTVTRQSLAEYYERLNDDELHRLLESGELTPVAQEVARGELRRRGIERPDLASEEATLEDDPGGGDLVLLARYWSPMEAEMVRARLTAEGVGAVIANAQIVQVTALMSSAFGGVRVLVPQSQLAQARDILKSIEAGRGST